MGERYTGGEDQGRAPLSVEGPCAGDLPRRVGGTKRASEVRLDEVPMAAPDRGGVEVDPHPPAAQVAEPPRGDHVHEVPAEHRCAEHLADTLGALGSRSTPS